MTELIPADLTADRLTALIAPWQLVLRAERKSPQTITSYLDGLHRYLTWCTAQDAEPMNRPSLNQFVAGMLDAGLAAGTARARQLAVRRFTAWLIVEGHLAADPFWGMKAPKVDQPVVEPLTDDELRALIGACAAPHRTELHEPLHHRRDEAIVRLMLETGIRVGEVVALEIGDLDLVNGLVTVRRGKGGIGRVVPIGPVAVAALRRYLDLRERHRRAHETDFVARPAGERLRLRRAEPRSAQARPASRY